MGLWLGLTCGYAVVTLISLYGVLSSDWKKVVDDALRRNEANREVTDGEGFIDSLAHHDPQTVQVTLENVNSHTIITEPLSKVSQETTTTLRQPLLLN